MQTPTEDLVIAIFRKFCSPKYFDPAKELYKNLGIIDPDKAENKTKIKNLCSKLRQALKEQFGPNFQEHWVHGRCLATNVASNIEIMVQKKIHNKKKQFGIFIAQAQAGMFCD